MSGQSCIWWKEDDEEEDGGAQLSAVQPLKPVAPSMVSNSAAAKLYDAAVAHSPLPKIAAPPPKKKKAAAKNSARVVIQQDSPTLPLFVSVPPRLVGVMPPKQAKPKAAKAKPKIKKAATPKKKAAAKKKSSIDSAVANLAKSVPKGSNITITITK